ncbi:phosphatase PAP2 family protein [Weissella paramesenteroides]|nr:phosphatase PAP2 family protein [Weissella paramesenteroides]RZQ59034.1 phosphatase PAP2 family protein [Weissella paramesenteroides]
MTNRREKLFGSGLLVIFIILVVSVAFNSDWVNAFDSSVTQLMANAYLPLNTAIFNIVTFLGSPLTVIILTALLCVWLFFKKQVITSLWLGGIQLAGSAITEIVKQVVARPRPINQLVPDTGFSFPSGHTFCTTILVLSVLSLLLLKIHDEENKLVVRLIGIVWIGFVAVSRVYLRDHFGSDVLASVILATGYWLLCTAYEAPIKSFIQRFLPDELNPMSWSKSNSWGFLMFSKEIQIEAVSMYLKGVPPVEIRRKFGIKAHSTLEIWVKSIKQDGIYGIKDSHRNKTSYPYSFKIKVINWRLNHNASYPITARKFRITSPSLIWHWERALESGRLKPDKRRRKRTMNKQEHDKIKKLEEENELLRIKVAYLEKLEALAQEKKKLQTKTKR